MGWGPVPRALHVQAPIDASGPERRNGYGPKQSGPWIQAARKVWVGWWVRYRRKETGPIVDAEHRLAGLNSSPRWFGLLGAQRPEPSLRALSH